MPESEEQSPIPGRNLSSEDVVHLDAQKKHEEDHLPAEQQEEKRRERIQEAYFGVNPKEEAKKKEEEPEKKKSFWHHLFLFFFNAAIIIGLVVLLRVFVLSPFLVDGHSMDTTFHDKDLILVDKLTYRFREPERGEVIVFRPPFPTSKSGGSIFCTGKEKLYNLVGAEFDLLEQCPDYYVKRIVGIPGDVVEIREGAVYVTPAGSSEQRKVDESYLHEGNKGNTCFTSACNGSKDINGVIYDPVPEGHLFVLGDNRPHSNDSPDWQERGDTPYVPYENVSGLVRLTFFPLGSMGVTDDVEMLP